MNVPGRFTQGWQKGTAWALNSRRSGRVMAFLHPQKSGFERRLSGQWPVAMYGCESWTLRKPDEAKINAFEMKCLRQVLRVSWTAKKTYEWVLNTAGVERSLLASVKERKLVYFGHVMRKK